jgi:hypothetical protein
MSRQLKMRKIEVMGPPKVQKYDVLSQSIFSNLKFTREDSKKEFLKDYKDLIPLPIRRLEGEIAYTTY